MISNKRSKLKSGADKPQIRPVPKPVGHRSHKLNEREMLLRKLNHYLKARRAKGRCEVPDCGSTYNLQGAHIIERSVGGKDTAGNIIIACGNCHDHTKYEHGLPFPQSDLLAYIWGKNREMLIRNSLTGADIGENFED